MAIPIRPTPVLEGKDAKRFREEMKQTQKPSPDIIKEIKRCFLIYQNFYARLRNNK